MVVISIIIATFNSEKYLSQVLGAIRRQTLRSEKFEILIVDGGSDDHTLEIARRYHCRIIHNRNIEPAHGKYLGFIKAKGRYVIYIDHDEVLVNPDSLKDRLQIFTMNQNAKVIISNGYINPVGYHIINQYINEFGDSFSYFIYHLSKNSEYFIPTMRSRYLCVKETVKYVIFDLSTFKQPPILELTAGGGMIDAQFVKATYPNVLKEEHLIAHLSHIIGIDYPYVVIMKNDSLIHYSTDNLYEYLKKIVWRVKNNIFFKDTIGASGFTGREEYANNVNQLKKIIFIPYAISCIFPILDAVYLIYTRRKFSYIIHVPLVIITAVLIMYFSILKLAGYKPVLRSYDGSTEVKHEE